jgi:tRNA(fMet)-specific endonuclease VapC
VALSRYCLDTSAYSQFKRGDPTVRDVLDQAEWVGMPSVVVGELLTGFLAGARAARNESELREFLGSPVVQLVVIDEAIARVYAEIVNALRQAGTPLPTNDIWIAAATARVGATLVTFDAHFDAVDRVGVMLLQSGGPRP